MRVCIIYPPALFGEISRNNTEHIGIEYINATLNSANISSTTVQCDSEGITINELYTILQNEKYDVVGLSVYFYNYISAVKISKYISKNLPDTFIIWGGYLPTLSYLKLKKDFNYVDCMIVGEGEHVFMNIVTALSSGINWRNEKGIVYKDEAKLVFTGPSKLINNLDQLPFPHHTNGNDTAIILTSRGCYANCSFCAIKAFYAEQEGCAVRYRSPKNVALEIREIVTNNPNVKTITINDDNFTLASTQRKQWIKQFYENILNFDIHVNFSCLVRANDINNGREELELLKAIGLKYVFIGIESFIQKHLDLYNKRITVQDNIDALKLLDELGLQPNIGFLLFNPITTIEEILETISIFKRIKFNCMHKYCIEPLSYSPVIATEGSPFYAYVQHHNLSQLKSPFYHFIDKRTEKCFEIIKCWYPKVRAIFKYSCLESILEAKGDIKLLMCLRECMYSLFWVDLNFLQDVCNKIKANISFNPHDIEEQWQQKLNVISNELMQIQKKLCDQN